MADREQPYDPYIPAGNNPAGGSTGQDGNHRTAALQAVCGFQYIALLSTSGVIVVA